FQDSFLAKTDPDGNILWALSGGGTEFDRGLRVFAGAENTIYLTGIIRKNSGSFDGLQILARSSGDVTLYALRFAETPALEIIASSGQTALAWSARATNYVLESAPVLGAGWSPADTGAL